MKRTWALFAVFMVLFLGTGRRLPAYYLSTVKVSDPDSCTCDIEIAASLPQDEPFFFWDGYATVDSLNLAAYLLFPQDMTPPGSCVADLEYGDGCQPDFAACGGDTITVALYDFSVVGWGPDLIYDGQAPSYEGPIDTRSLTLTYSPVTINVKNPGTICRGQPYDFKVTAMQGRRDISSQAVTTVMMNGVTIATGTGQYPGITLPYMGANTAVQFLITATGCGCESATQKLGGTVTSSGCVHLVPMPGQPTPTPVPIPVQPKPPSCLRY